MYDDRQFTVWMNYDHDGERVEPGVQSDESLIADAQHLISDNVPADERSRVKFVIDGPKSRITFRGPDSVIAAFFRILGEIPDLEVIGVPEQAVLVTMADYNEADAPAAELTERIMRGMDCTNPSKFEQHVKATLTSHIAYEAAERRAFARRAFTSPRHV
jgi:hypothetical protein